jgi:hypothetical protein
MRQADASRIRVTAGGTTCLASRVRALVRQQPPVAEQGDQAMGTTKDIRSAVKAELSFDPLVDESGIAVKNMNGTSR